MQVEAQGELAEESAAGTEAVVDGAIVGQSGSRKDNSWGRVAMLALSRKEQKMKYKVIDLLNMSSALGKLLNADLPTKTSYWIKRKLKPFITEIKDIEKTRNEIMKKRVVEKDEKGNNITKNAEEINKEWADFLQVELDLSHETIDINELEGIKLTANDLELLENIVVGEPKEVKK